jgi:RimJ/RimL family protein N-acetyltransferase
LIGAVKELDARRLWLITTNDNVRAQRFYERCGFELVAVHEGAVDRARVAKPDIPLLGDGGVEIHDELAYELRPE